MPSPSSPRCSRARHATIPQHAPVRPVVVDRPSSRGVRVPSVRPRRMPPPFAMTATFVAALAVGAAAVTALFRAPAGETPVALFVHAFALATVGLWIASHVDLAIEHARCALARRRLREQIARPPAGLSIRVAASR